MLYCQLDFNIADAALKSTLEGHTRHILGLEAFNNNIFQISQKALKDEAERGFLGVGDAELQKSSVPYQLARIVRQFLYAKRLRSDESLATTNQSSMFNAYMHTPLMWMYEPAPQMDPRHTYLEFWLGGPSNAAGTLVTPVSPQPSS